MDFLEQWFHISPDGGNGWSEAALVGAMVIIAAVKVARTINRLKPRKL